MDKLTEIRLPIESDLSRYRELFESTLKTDNPLLELALKHIMQRQGKLMRPILVLLTARLVGEVNKKVLNAAVALELLHTASLVHDDIVDESDRRRGQKSVNALLNNQAAVLVGDFLLSKALYHAAATESNRVVRWVGELGQALADGELMQMANFESTTFSESNCIEIIEKKTATLFQVCCKTGAMLGGGSEKDIEQMGEFGMKLGTCFQIRDDLLDYISDCDTGKPTGIDMREGKLTLPIVTALNLRHNDEMCAIAIRVREGSATSDEIHKLVTFANEVGGSALASQQMHSLANESAEFLKDESRNPAVVESLLSYVDFVVGRNI